MGFRLLAKGILRRAGYFSLALLVVFGLEVLQVRADESEADRPTMTRAINIDEASVDSAVYVTGSIDNDFSQGHTIDLEGEGLFRLDQDWGLDVTFPQVLLQQPLGQGPAALGPLGAGLRYVFQRVKTEDGQVGGIFSLEAQGFYWATPDNQFPGTGSGYTLQGLGALRVGRVYLQGNYGYNGAFDQMVTPSWFANSSLGYALGAHWALQVEADYTGQVLPGNGGLAGQWTLVPQIGFKTDGWLWEVGEAFNPSQAGTATDLIIERNFF